RPVVRVHQRFQWRHLLAFVHPASGRTEWQVSSGINTAVMSVALEYFARAAGAGPRKRIVLVLDQAGYHTSPLVHVPAGLHLVFLPPYSPELQPAEHLWHYPDHPSSTSTSPLSRRSKTPWPTTVFGSKVSVRFSAVPPSFTGGLLSSTEGVQRKMVSHGSPFLLMLMRMPGHAKSPRPSRLVYWLPRSECCPSPARGRRWASAMSSAVLTRRSSRQRSIA